MSNKTEHLNTQQLKELKSFVERMLGEKEPLLFAEWKRLDGMLESAGEGDYAQYKTPREAVIAVLSESENNWLTKSEILKRLEAGGFIKNQTMRWNVSGLIDYYTDPSKAPKKFKQGGKTVVLQGVGKGMDMLVGLPGWKKPH